MSWIPIQNNYDRLRTKNALHEQQLRTELARRRQEAQKYAKEGLTEAEGRKFCWDGLLFWKKKK